MRGVFGVSLLLLTGAVASAQDATPPATISVEFSPQERDYLMQMCEAAKWAARVQFDGCGDQLRAKFLDAERKAKPAPKPEK